VEYGGQFENLQSAKARLMIAVPLALFNIYPIVFCFWFHQRSLNGLLMIPLSAVGGVLFLYMRGLPFSISAGVGFIAFWNRSIKRNH
jgi:cobalt-zinc-cadmium resistance protein CzcA